MKEIIQNKSNQTNGISWQAKLVIKSGKTLFIRVIPVQKLLYSSTVNSSGAFQTHTNL